MSVSSEGVVVRAPGRVNLIGEHTDYSLLPVLPMAIDRSVEIRAETGVDGKVVLSSRLYADQMVTFHATGLPERLDGWAGYVVAALRVVGVPDGGIRLEVGGDLPTNGGLSSSSALTVGVIAAIDVITGLGLGPVRYPRLAQLAERSMSIEGGAMDQTVISLAVEGDALRIDFLPPRVTPVPIPSGVEFVAAYCGETAPKATKVRDHYNSRVVATRLACVLISNATATDPPSDLALGRMAGIPEVMEVVAELPESVTADEIARSCDIAVDGLTGLAVGPFPGDIPVPVRVTATHVLNEAMRVDQMEDALRDGALGEVGRLLDESHRSLQRFGASLPALDRLVSSMRAAGAYGARLTGAGFGGYTVAAVPEDLVDDVVSAAVMSTGGPAFPVAASNGVSIR